MVLSRNQASLVDITAVHMNMMIIMMILVEPAGAAARRSAPLVLCLECQHKPLQRADSIVVNSYSHMGFELMIIELTFNYKEKWLYVLGYKPPEIKNSVFENAFQFLCDVILNESSNIVLLGDYNCNLLEENSLAHTCDTYDLHNLVTSATCFKGAKGTLIYLCLVSKPLRFKATLNLDCWLSDFHNFICITTKLNMPRRPPNVIRYRSYKKFDQSKFTCDLYVISEIMSSLHNNVNIVRWKRTPFAIIMFLIWTQIYVNYNINVKWWEIWKIQTQILKISNAIAYCEINVLNWGCLHNVNISSSAVTAAPKISIFGQQ